MKYVLVFMPNTCAYCVHDEGCSAATNQTKANGGARRHRIPQTFETIEAARTYADVDEYEKGDDEGCADARFRVCKCAKVVRPTAAIMRRLEAVRQLKLRTERYRAAGRGDTAEKRIAERELIEAALRLAPIL